MGEQEGVGQPRDAARRGGRAGAARGRLRGAHLDTRLELQTHAIQPFRESVQLTRPWLDPEAPENREVVTVSFSFAARYYDPWGHQLRQVDELRQWMEHADDTGRSLYVNIGRPRVSRKKYAAFMQIVDDPGLFDEVAHLPGLLHRGERKVWRYRGGRPAR